MLAELLSSHLPLVAVMCFFLMAIIDELQVAVVSCPVHNLCVLKQSHITVLIERHRSNGTLIPLLSHLS